MSYTRLWVIALALLAHSFAHGHSTSNSYIVVEPNSVQLQVPLTDIELAVGLDANGDGAITWGELKARQTEVVAWASSGIALLAKGRPCELSQQGFTGLRKNEQGYAQIRLGFTCTAEVFRYQLLFDLDPTHRALVSTPAGATVLTPSANAIDIGSNSTGQNFVAFLLQGIWHIWIGIDHILFLFMLLLPAVLVHTANRGWTGAPQFTPALVETIKIVTAFTLAHSITLALAAFEWVVIPSKWVEAAIAASVVFCALNNLKPLIPTARWWLAFAFGLIHGFGFASVLGDLTLEKTQLLWPLLGFNLGVELGQMALVALALPLAYWTRHTKLYRYGVFGAGSVVCAGLGSYWVVVRLLG